MKRLVVMLLINSLCVACAATAADSSKPPAGVAPPQRVPAPLHEGTPVGKPVTTAEIPRDVRRAVVADAARRFKVPESSVVLARAEAVTWPDGSLGCPRPGEMYPQALVPGFRILAKTSGGEILYNTDSLGKVRNCPLPEGVAPAPPDR